jgi:[protein-PII] uridylyltransferase
LHDIGKGWPGDHSVVGEPIAARIAARMGFPEHDVGMIAAMVRHHLLLPDTATRRDVDDPATVDRVAETLGGDLTLLRLLHALAHADAEATGPGAWSPWKAHLVGALVARVAARLGPSPADAHEPLLVPTDDRVSVAPPDIPGQTEKVTVGVAQVADGQQVTIGAPDRPGLFSVCAGVLALHQLDVRAANTVTTAGVATAVFAVRPRFGRAPVPEILADAVRAALEGTLPLAERLRQREADYHQDVGSGPPPRISWHDGEVSGEDTGIVEVRAADCAGLLHRLAAALTASGLDVSAARIETFGADVVDSFYVRNPSGGPIGAEQRERVESALAAAADGG